MTDLSRKPHTVYRYYDATDRLLYVGCTSNLVQREYSHRPKPWFGRVARRELRVYPNRRSGLHAEALAIRTEHPEFNVQNAEPEKTLNVRQVAKLAGLSVSLVNLAVQRGELPSTSIGADGYNRRILRADVEPWLRSFPAA